MALGRAGRIEEGIQFLTVYIRRNPGDSHAYTKRGVRHIWNGDLKAAKRDLTRAIELDPGNAEAHAQRAVHLLQQPQLGHSLAFLLCFPFRFGTLIGSHISVLPGARNVGRRSCQVYNIGCKPSNCCALSKKVEFARVAELRRVEPVCSQKSTISRSRISS